MRLDVVTIFPEYLDPLRRALLGKAIESGILAVGVHDLRAFATDRHRSVDDTPFGGGPGMVMKPEVWGPALDAVAAGTAPGEDLTTAEAHRGDARHDELAGIEPRGYASASEETDRDKPLLLVPTPAGRPFTQADAQAWSTEEHIVIACGRYEGIDARVFADAAARYRVREVSIGDYVLVGGEVAALVIAEAVVRLIPGVLGNQRSHEEDSFSDGLLEGPSYTKPRVWRGREVPEVLTSGNHAAIAAWRREESLATTARVRPELLAAAELTDAERERWRVRKLSVDLSVLLTPAEWEAAAAALPGRLRERGVEPAAVFATPVDFTCEPDNMLINQYRIDNDQPPIAEVLYHVVIHARTALPAAEVTRAAVAALPEGTYWYGTTVDGWASPEVTAACAWREPGAGLR